VAGAGAQGAVWALLPILGYLSGERLDFAVTAFIAAGFGALATLGAFLPAYLAFSMPIKTIAEFVEDEATLRLLTELGVDYAQGYFHHRPEVLG
jgi:hypothetical protein